MGFIARMPPAPRGVAYMVASCAAFAVVWALIRLASETMASPLIVFYRTLFGLLFMVPILVRGGPALFRTRRLKLHVIRGASGLAAMYATFYAVAAAPLADVVAISYAAPLFATLAAVLFLGEIIRLRRIAGLVIGFFGMLLVLRPGIQDLQPGQWAALGGAVMVAGSLTAVKLLSRSETPETIVSFTYVLSLPVNFVVALFFWQWPTPAELVLLIGIGVLANIGQMTLARSFAAADATAVLPFDFVRLVIAAALGAILFGERLDWQTVVGALVILLSTVYLAHREARLGRASKTAVLSEEALARRERDPGAPP